MTLYNHLHMCTSAWIELRLHIDGTLPSHNYSLLVWLGIICHPKDKPTTPYTGFSYLKRKRTVLLWINLHLQSNKSEIEKWALKCMELLDCFSWKNNESVRGTWSVIRICALPGTLLLSILFCLIKFSE